MLQSGLTSFLYLSLLLIFSRSGPVRFHASVPPKGGFLFIKKPRRSDKTNLSGFLKKGLVVTLIFILARSFGFLAALYARALVIFLLAQIGQDAGLRAAAFESLQRIVQRLVLLHVNFRH